ncbi:MAG: DUF2911 domain-containing protein [Gemmatimonadota bacterium]
MHRTRALPLLMLCLTTSLAAQARPVKAGFIVHLGNDTVAVERYTRSGSQLEGDVAVRVPRTRLFHYRASLAPDGTVARLETTMRLAGAPAGTPPAQGGVATFTRDSAILEMRAGDSVRPTVRLATHPGALPIINFSFALYEQGTMQLFRSHADSSLMDVVFFGAPRVFPIAFSKHGADSVYIDYFGHPFSARVDGKGTILGLDGAQTTQKWIVQRVSDVDVEGFAANSGATEAAGHGIGMLSPRDTARAEIGGAKVMVDYGRPARRGRAIFGGIVPWGEVWRTGANAATQLITDHALTIGGTAVPAGTYSLWTVPTQNGATLIINSQHGQWGTEYDGSKDFVKIPLTSVHAAEPVDRFTITLAPSGNGGTLLMAWDTLQLSAPIAAAAP